MAKPKKHNAKQKATAAKKSYFLSPLQKTGFWRDKKNLLFGLALIAITLIAFYPSLDNDFVNYDDDANLYENQHVLNPGMESFKKIFTSTVIGNYNPLPIFTFTLENYFFGLNPSVFHLTNVILHLLASLLVFWIMGLLGTNRLTAIIAAILFAVHPMRVESVAWITERKDVLYGVFYLAAIINYLLYHKKRKKQNLVWLYLFFVLSLFSKIQAVALPLSLMVIDYYIEKKLSWKMLTSKIPMFALSLLFGLLGIYFLSQAESLDIDTYGFLEKILVGAYSLMVYIIKSIVPFNMSAVHPYPIPSNLGTVFYISPIIILVLAYLVFLTRKKRRDIIFGTLFFLVNIVFLLQVVGAGQGFLAERFTYIPYIGLFFIYARIVSSVVEKNIKLAIPVYVIFAALTIYSITSTRARSDVWENSGTLWTDVLNKYDNVDVAFRNRGNFYREQGQYEKAIADYNRLLSIKPKEHGTYLNRGRLYYNLQKYDLAFEDFDKAISLNKNSVLAFLNRGTIYSMRGEFEPALRDFEQAIELNPNIPDIYSNRALVYSTINEYEKAIEDCNQYLKLVSNDASMYNMRGVCYVSLGKFEEALKDYNTAIKLDPTKGSYYLNRSGALFNTGEGQKALNDIQKAQELGVQVDPGYVENVRRAGSSTQ